MTVASPTCPICGATKATEEPEDPYLMCMPTGPVPAGAAEAPRCLATGRRVSSIPRWRGAWYNMRLESLDREAS
jgi:hypothetical protein